MKGIISTNSCIAAVSKLLSPTLFLIKYLDLYVLAYKYQGIVYEIGSMIENLQGKEYCDRLSEYIPMYQRECNNDIDNAYKQSIKKRKWHGDEEETHNICLLRQSCNEECIVYKCKDDCTNNKIQKGEWCSTYIDYSTNNGLGSKDTVLIKKVFII